MISYLPVRQLANKKSLAISAMAKTVKTRHSFGAFDAIVAPHGTRTGQLKSLSLLDPKLRCMSPIIFTTGTQICLQFVVSLNPHKASQDPKQRTNKFSLATKGFKCHPEVSHKVDVLECKCIDMTCKKKTHIKNYQMQSACHHFPYSIVLVNNDQELTNGCKGSRQIHNFLQIYNIRTC